MEINKDLSLFREFLKAKHKYAIIYANQTSQFAEKNYRKKAFTIKSDLAHDFDKDEILYIPVNLWRVITRIFKDYVIGMWFSVDFGDEEKNAKFVSLSDRIELKLLLDEAITGQSSIGYSIVRVRKWDNGMPRVEFIPLPNYCANMQGLWIGDKFEDIKEHFIFSVQKDEKGKRYMYVDRYEKIDNAINEDGNVLKGRMWYYWEKREYNKDFVFKNRVTEGREEFLEDLPLFIFNNDLTNVNVVDATDSKVIQQKGFVGEIPRYFNQSDYVDLADLFQEINDRWSQISVEMIKNLTSKMSVPAGFKDARNAQKLRKQKEGWKEFVDNPDFLIHNPWETPAQYITKDSSYLNMTIQQYIPMLLKFIGCIAGVPSALLYNAIFSWNAPVWTSDKEWQIFYSRIESKQQRIYSSLQRMFVLLMKYLWEEVDYPTIRFKKPAVYDTGERTVTAIQQMNAWIMSKESAIAYIMGYDEVEVQEELKKINEEERDAYAKYRTTSFLDDNEDNENDNTTE